MTEKRRLAIVCIGILADRAEGLTWAQITAELNARGVPSPTGGSWTPGDVRDLLKREEPDADEAPPGGA